MLGLNDLFCGAHNIGTWQPRKIFVQPNSFIIDDKVVLKDYPLNPAGLIESFIERDL